MTEAGDNLLTFGTYNLSLHPRFKVLLEGLAASGYGVVEINEPLNFSTADRVSALGDPRVLARFLTQVAAKWIQLWRRGGRYIRTQGRPATVIVGYMGHFDVLLTRARFPKAQIILDHLIFAGDTAKDRGAGGRAVQMALRCLDRLALRTANIIVVDTREHAQMVPRSCRRKTVVVPVGAPIAWFSARDQRTSVSSPLSVIFFGLFTPLQGTPFIAEALALAAKKRPLKITMVGSGQDYAQCREILSSTPVSWIDWLSPSDLRQLVAQHDICLGIFGQTAKGKNVVPNKVYQGMATAAAVVTSDTAPQRRVLGDAVQYVRAGETRQLADLLVSASPGDVAGWQEEAARWADQHFLPEEVVTELVEKLR